MSYLATPTIENISLTKMVFILTWDHGLMHLVTENLIQMVLKL